MGDSFGDAFLGGAGMTIGIAAVEESIPGIGQIVAGVFAAKAIAGGQLGHDVDAVKGMGEGRSGYEEAANDIEGACAILDFASNIVNVLAGVAGIVTAAATAAAFLTLGALAPLAVAAGEVALALGATGAVLGGVKMALQPLVVLFRSLHEFTSQADPQQIEADGRVLEEGGKEMGGALGGLWISFGYSAITLCIITRVTIAVQFAGTLRTWTRRWGRDGILSPFRFHVPGKRAIRDASKTEVSTFAAFVECFLSRAFSVCSTSPPSSTGRLIAYQAW